MLLSAEEANEQGTESPDYSRKPEFDVAEKPINIGVLDYLKELGQWEKGSIYRVGDLLAEGDDVKPSEMGSDRLLRYEITETFIYYDSLTGKFFDAPREGMDDVAISVRDLKPMVYEFQFKQTLFGDPDSAAGAPDDKEIHYKENIDYVIGETSEFGHYVPETTQRRMVNPVGDITGVFCGPDGFNEDGTPKGGSEPGRGIYNDKNKELNSIHADFFDCRTTTTSGGGGAISNWNGTTIKGGIFGNFMNNSAVKNTVQGAEGGAIWNWDHVDISVIDGNFIANHIGKEGAHSVRGGAIYNYNHSHIGTLTGYFVGNSAMGSAYSGSGVGGDSCVVGGAIANAGGSVIDLIVADFIGNTVLMTAADGHGGAIYNGGKDTVIKNLIGDFYGNSVDMPAYRETGNYDGVVYGHGGAICNIGIYQGFDDGGASIENLQGAFVRNYVRVTVHASGGAIYNNRGAYIGTIQANFVQNFVESTFTKEQAAAVKLKDTPRASGGAIVNFFKSTSANGQNSRIHEIIGNFYGNYALARDGIAEGGAIANWSGGSNIDNITGNFIGNYAKSDSDIARGGAIYTEYGSTISEISGSFYDNYAESASGYARGGAISNGGTLDSIVNAVFEGNYAKGMKPGQVDGASVHGGAIFNVGTLNIVADNGVSYFNNNYIIETDEQGNELSKVDEAIYATWGEIVNDKGVKERIKSEISLISKNNGAIIFEDMINGVDYDLLLMGDNSSRIVFDHIVKNARITMDDVTLYLYSGESGKWEGERLSFLDPKERKENYAYSDVLRDSSLELRSGRVSLMDNVPTEYLFKEIVVHGKSNPYYTDTPERHTSFTIDVDLNTTSADVITAFADKTGEGSRGYVELSDFNVVYAGYWETDEAAFGKPVVVQVINFVLLDENGTAISGSTDYDPYDPYKSAETGCPIELEEVGELVQERSRMLSSQQLPKGVALGTTDTYHDSLVFQSFRDNLAAWAEMDQDGKWVRSDVYGDKAFDSYDDAKDAGFSQKVFTLVSKMHRLTRDTRDKALSEQTGEEVFSGAVWGDSWVIRGLGAVLHAPALAGKFTLDLADHNLLTEVKAGKEGFLQAFHLVRVNDKGITNEGKLTFDTMRLESKLKVFNKNELIITGFMDIDNIITSDPPETSDPLKAQHSLVIDDSSQVVREYIPVEPEAGESPDADTPMPLSEEAPHGYTYVNIKGSVSHQNIIIKGSGEVSRHGDKTSFDSSTVANLVITNDSGHKSDAFERFQNNSLSMRGGLFNLYNLGGETLSLRHLDLQGGSIHILNPVHVNLEAATMGRIDARSYDYDSAGDAHIFVDSLKLVKSSTFDEVRVDFADESIAASVVPFADEKIGATGSESSIHYMWDPIIMWHVTYEYKSGQYVFRKYPLMPKPTEPDPEPEPEPEPDPEPEPPVPDPPVPDPPGPGSGSLVFNPAVMPGPVAERMGGYGSMQAVYDASFEHADFFSPTINRSRIANLYEESHVTVTPVKGDKNAVPSAHRRPKSTESKAGFKGGMWVRPYSSYEHIPVYGDVKARVSLYGALVGGDTDLTEYQSGWASVFSAFIGYTGSTQKFSKRDSSVRTTQNGGVVGVTETLYYRNFYTAFTGVFGTAAAHAASVYGNGSVVSGSENFRMTMAGIAARAGYNFELEKGRYVLQPTLQLSYTNIRMPAYTNASGVRIVSDALNAIQIHPYIKAVMNTDCGWNPFITIGYVHDFMGKTHYRAGEYTLPSVGVDPYVEYSLGIQKTWVDKYTFYLQAIGRNGGRNGFEINTGLRWAW